MLRRLSAIFLGLSTPESYSCDEFVEQTTTTSAMALCGQQVPMIPLLSGSSQQRKSSRIRPKNWTEFSLDGNLDHTRIAVWFGDRFLCGGLLLQARQDRSSGK